MAGVTVLLKICLVIRSRSMAREMALRRSGLSFSCGSFGENVIQLMTGRLALGVPVGEVGLVRVADELVLRDVAVVDVVEAAGHGVGVGRRGILVDPEGQLVHVRLGRAGEVGELGEHELGVADLRPS